MNQYSKDNKSAKSNNVPVKTDLYDSQPVQTITLESKLLISLKYEERGV